MRWRQAAPSFFSRVLCSYFSTSSSVLYLSHSSQLMAHSSQLFSCRTRIVFPEYFLRTSFVLPSLLLRVFFVYSSSVLRLFFGFTPVLFVQNRRTHEETPKKVRIWYGGCTKSTHYTLTILTTRRKLHPVSAASLQSMAIFLAYSKAKKLSTAKVSANVCGNK